LKIVKKDREYLKNQWERRTQPERERRAERDVGVDCKQYE
jgi:hypothetical protein